MTLADAWRNDQWILDRPGSPYHRLVRTACAAAGFQPETAHQSREWETGAALVSAGLGVALIPRLARLPDGFDVVRVPLRGDPVPSRKILTGIRIGLGVGWSTLVAAELIAATSGLGFMVQSAAQFLVTDMVLAGIVVIGGIAFVLELGLRALQQRLCPWHGQQD